jgi:hypothetical protein
MKFMKEIGPNARIKMFLVTAQLSYLSIFAQLD